jgi:hypothetical protein
VNDIGTITDVDVLRAFLAALDALTAEDFKNGKFSVVGPDGKRVRLSPDEVAAARGQINDRIDALTTSVLESAAGAVAGAVGRLGEPAVSPAEQRSRETAAQQEKYRVKIEKLIDNYNNAVAKRDTTVLEVAGVKGGAEYKTEKDIARWEGEIVKAEKALRAQGLVRDEATGTFVRIDQTEQAPSVATPSTPVVRGAAPPGVRGGLAASGAGAATETTMGTGATGRVQVVPDRLASPAKAPAPAASAATGAATGGGAGPVVTDQQVTSALTRRGLADTPANRNQVRRELRVAANSDAWMATFTSEYPAYASWTTQEVIGYFGQDFVDVINKIALSGIEYTDEEKKAMLRNTRYFQQTTNNQQTFDKSRPAVQQQLVDQMANGIREEYGDVQFSETEIQGLARTAARNGLTGVGLRQEVYRTAFRTSEASKAPMLATQSLTGADADRIQRIGRAYGRRIRDEELKAILTGEPLNGAVLTEEGLRQRLQIEARAAFPQLADQIDAGLTLDDIGSRYKSYAADLLERDPNQIDMFSGPYLSAFGDKANGPMSLSDWTAKVKSDPVFGWQYTKQANDQATNIALSLARVFGKVG